MTTSDDHATNEPPPTRKRAGIPASDALPSTEAERLLSVGQVANMLDVSRNTVYYLIRCGRLPSTHVRHGIRIHARDLSNFRRRHRRRLRAALGVEQAKALFSREHGPAGLEPELDPSTEAARQTENLMLFVQAVHGAPASVLLALGFAGRFLTVRDLQIWTRCGHTQISLALRALRALGWVQARSSHGPWVLAADRRLPFTFYFHDESALKALSSSSDSLNPPEEKPLLPGARSERLIQSMYELGIREPTATELSELPHMSLEYLQAHTRAAKANGLRVGSAIEAMRAGAPPPPEPARTDRLAEVEEKIRRFVEGP